MHHHPQVSIRQNYPQVSSHRPDLSFGVIGFQLNSILGFFIDYLLADAALDLRVLTMKLSRAAAFALGCSLQDTAHNQIEPRYNRREAASAAVVVGPPPTIVLIL
jgi:hypothetical protein